MSKRWMKVRVFGLVVKVRRVRPPRRGRARREARLALLVGVTALLDAVRVLLELVDVLWLQP